MSYENYENYMNIWEVRFVSESVRSDASYSDYNTEVDCLHVCIVHVSV